MPADKWTPKQQHFFNAVGHGWKPPASMHSTLTPEKANEMMGRENAKVQARKKGQIRALTK